MITRSNSPVLLLILLPAVAITGCAASPWAAKAKPGSEIAPGGGSATTSGPRTTPSGGPLPTIPSPNRPAPNPPIPNPPIPNPMAAGGSAPSPQDLQQVMADVERLGTVDPRAQARLLEELKQVEPSLWPMAVKSVWSRVAYARRFNQEQQKKHLADRRSVDIDRHRKEINSRKEWPPTAGVPYPTTAATVESRLPNIGPPAQPNKPRPPESSRAANIAPPNTAPRNTAPRNTAPTGRPQHEGYRGGYIEQRPAAPNAAPRQSGNNPGNAPPWPDQGSARDAADTHATTAAKTRPGGVIHAAYFADPPERNGPSKRNGPADADWRTRLAEAITALQSRLAAADVSDADADNSRSADHARLRILQLLAGRRDDALTEMPIDDTALRDFWAKEIFGLDVLLDSQRFSRDRDRAAVAKRHLSDAVLSLGESAALEVHNMAFCREVQSYGSIKRFEKLEFSPGQRVLLYAEIDNFRSENTAQGYHTSLQSNFQIFDSSGRCIDKRKSTTTEEHCISPRRDYFIGCDFRLPTNISPGRHTLKLTVEDLKSHKVGDSSIDFTVVKR